MKKLLKWVHSLFTYKSMADRIEDGEYVGYGITSNDSNDTSPPSGYVCKSKCFDYEAALKKLHSSCKIKIDISPGGKSAMFEIKEGTSYEYEEDGYEWTTLGIGNTLRAAILYATSVKNSRECKLRQED